MPGSTALGRIVGQASRVRRRYVLGTASLSWAVVGVLTLALSGCGGTSVGSSPAGVVKDLFAAYQANDCNRVFDLQTKALDGGEGGKTGVCRTTVALAARYRGNTFRVDRVDRHDDSADVFATRTNPDGTTRSATLGVKVEDGRWKVDSLQTSTPSATSTSSVASTLPSSSRPSTTVGRSSTTPSSGSSGTTAPATTTP